MQMITRRHLFHGGLAASVTVLLPRFLRAETGTAFHNLPQAFGRLEKVNTGRLGVFVLDTASGRTTGYRADERFTMCSTFKFLLVAAVLQRADTGGEHLDRPIAIPAKPLLGHSPLTEPHAGATMSVAALCHASLTQSDNTAANLLLESIGGPAAFTRFARSLGDTQTRLDRTEPTLNESKPGDPRDTTTPAAAAADMRRVLLGDVLSATARDQLTQWIIANETGLNALRARLPAGWTAGDKTGSDGQTINNDIAILWPAMGAPILVTAYLKECPGTDAKRKAVLAEVAALVVKAAQHP